MSQFIDRREVLQRTALSTSALYRLVRAGKFPKQVRISPNKVCWDLSEIEVWQQERLAERDTPHALRANVRKSLEARAARKAASHGRAS
jgi:prophage regulatory protein